VSAPSARGRQSGQEEGTKSNCAGPEKQKTNFDTANPRDSRAAEMRSGERIKKRIRNTIKTKIKMMIRIMKRTGIKC
jgi:hypothetical protein